MKAVNKWGIGAVLAGMMLGSCTKGFEDLNKSPNVSDNTAPELLITQSVKSIVDRDFDWFYDNYQYEMQWMQFVTAAPNSSVATLFTPTNTNDFYGALYKNIGRNLVDIEEMVKKMPEEQKGKYAQLVAIAKIIKVYASWRVSDANGSIPYTQAWTSRYGGTFTPVYDNQETLFATWDAELKAALATLTQGLQNQVSYGAGDIFYNGNAANWAKAGNVLRLKLAMRLLKRSPEKVGPIAKEVLASTAGIFSGLDDEWKFISAETNFARGGNWSMDNSPIVAAKNMVDYMNANKDPRIGLFFEKNTYTQSAFDSLKAGGALSAGAIYDGQRYVGLPSSPAQRTSATYAALFAKKTYVLNLNGKQVTVNHDTVSNIQKRLFDLNQEGNGPGKYTQPILTYAEMCFMLSELSVRGIIAEDAKAWYEKGITASVNAYDKMGSLANIKDYTAVNPAAIQAYIAMPNVAFTGSTAVLLEKINIQNFLNHYKSPWEAWGAWKRADVPKVGGILPFEPFVSAQGTNIVVPRRWALPQPGTNDNMPNWRNAIAEMQKTGEYGNDANTFTGRVWWDKQ
ncbi:MAG: SusD/RagB family nutrient-binding outer membrane lipoprotein [Chitinophaga sp.]|uniref:SusD/RagB family nutrient-binding outer membrane lipoprotein n=1 Tax=Chitinophaga sp. TaxID=1869181 RepID=UPI001B0850F8|nr:SusD/RagB family nutrient-binding outer membrane lipoprotein [Chitinophaga sp.]MBO9727663.1 SusD/RagB family nutrient-binding outer membrane lipoprotein [Chitinophaga sp.]